MRKSPRVLKGGKPPLRDKMAALARVKENFCSISRRGMVGGTEVVVGWLVRRVRCAGVSTL